MAEPIRYRLQVSGGSCRPWLDIAQTETDQAIVSWSSAAIGYQLETTDTLSPPQFAPTDPPPVVVDGKNTVTHSPAGASRFYRLRQP